MGSQTPKVLMPIAGRPLLSYVIDAVKAAGCGRVVVVVGAGRRRVMSEYRDADVEFVVQASQRGTADAVLSCRPLLGPEDECVAVAGDVPLMRPRTIRRLIDARQDLAADVAVLTATLDDPQGYGRILRDADGWVAAIVEERDADEAVRRVREVNSGFYAFAWGRLLPAMERVQPSPVTGEYYLTDAVREVRSDGGRVAAVPMADPLEMAGVNTPEQLAEVSVQLRRRNHSPGR